MLLGATFVPALEFKRQVITMSPDPSWLTGSRLKDIDNDGLTDLLAIVPLERMLQVFRQQKSGFTTTPDQTIALPEQTAWIGSYDVDAHPGNELVLSTSTGILYLRQNNGVFEPSLRTLIEAQQVFLTEYPKIMAESDKSEDVNEFIPVIFPDHAVLYEKNEGSQWRPDRNLDLHMTNSRWQREHLDWMAGTNKSQSVSIRTWFRLYEEEDRIDEEKAENPAIQKLIDDVKKHEESSTHGVKRMDVNGDGREDLVLWKSKRDMNPKTVVLVLIRGRNGQLPERPTHMLRGNGVPVRINREQGISPMWDLDGDGKCELVLLALKTRIMSWTGLVDVALTGGVDWIFTVRSGKDDDYSGGPDFQMDITSRTPSEKSVEWMFQIDGDFNGDGRDDILIERSSNQYDVYLSDAGTGFFRKESPMSMKAPIDAWTHIDDFNGDGIDDLFVQERRVTRVTMFLSQSGNKKGTPK